MTGWCLGAMKGLEKHPKNHRKKPKQLSEMEKLLDEIEQHRGRYNALFDAAMAAYKKGDKMRGRPLLQEAVQAGEWMNALLGMLAFEHMQIEEMDEQPGLTG